MNLLGLYNTETNNGYSVLTDNLGEVCKHAVSLEHNYGLRTEDTALLLNDSYVAKGNRSAELSTDNVELKVDTTPLDTKDRDVYISLDDYNNILKSIPTSGNKALDISARYHIVDAVGENTETPYNFSKPDCPIIVLHYFNQRVKSGGYIYVRYSVDTYKMDSINRNHVDDWFTVIINNSAGTILSKETHYAGEYVTKVGPFELPQDEKNVEDWLEIKAIDKDGCVSQSVFCDIIIESTNEPVLLSFTKEQLYSRFKITEGVVGSNEVEQDEIAYLNKFGLSNLFSYAKNAGADGVKLPANCTFMLSHNRNMCTTPDRAMPNNMDGTLDTSIIKYFKVKAEKDTTSGDTENTYIYTEVHQIYWEEFIYACRNYLWFNYTDDKVLWSAGNPKTNTVYALDKFESYYLSNNALVSQEKDSNGKLVETPWTEEEISKHILYKPQKTSLIPKVGEVVAPHQDHILGPVPVDFTQVGTDGYLYLMVVRAVTDRDDNKLHPRSLTSPDLDNIVIPDNFILDLNGSTLKAMDFSMRWHKGALIPLTKSYNVKIINGIISGSFYNFSEASNLVRYTSSVHGIPKSCYYLHNDGKVNAPKYKPYLYKVTAGEGVDAVAMDCSRHCLLDKVKLEHCMGYTPSFKEVDRKSNTLSWELSTYTDSAVNDLIARLTAEFEDSTLNSVENFPLELFRGKDTRMFSITELHELKKVKIEGDDVGIIENREHYIISFDGSVYAFKQGNRDYGLLLCYKKVGTKPVLTKIIKCWHNQHIRIPSEITYVRLLVYGRNGKYTTIKETGPNYKSNPVLFMAYECTNNVLSNSVINHTKTVVVHPNASTMTVYKNCTFSGISTGYAEIYGFSGTTQSFGDLEEGGYAIDRLCLVNCHNTLTDNDTGRRKLGYHNGSQVFLENCTGIAISDTGRVRHNTYINCDIPQMLTCYKCDPGINHTRIKKCRIGKDFGHPFYKSIHFEQDSYFYPQRPGNEDVITLIDCDIDEHIHYNNFNLHRVTNGKQAFD